jgi:hypothetical protein
MAAVRIRTCREPGKVTDHSVVRPPTDAMSSHPYHSPLLTNIYGHKGSFVL